MTVPQYVVDDPRHLDFRVHRGALADPEVLERERRRIFDTCWIYAGHESEVVAPGDFRTRNVCGRPIIFCRDSQGAVRVFLNSCRHRGALVCREPAGNARGYHCFYHGWSYDRDGNLDGVPGQASYPESFDRCKLGLAEPPRVDAYRGFVFLSFDPDAQPLADYLAGAKEYIDLIVDQSPTGAMEVIRGVQEYDIRANWKLLVENSFDDYHLMSTHSTWLNYMKSSGVEIKRPAKGHLMPSHGVGKALGNGHAVIDNENFRGRPVAKWIPLYGEDAKPEIERIRAELVAAPRRGTRAARGGHQSQSGRLPQPRVERRLVGDDPHVPSPCRGSHAGARVGARAERRVGEGACDPARQLPHVLRPGRIRHAGRRRGAGIGAERIGDVARDPLVGDDARHEQARRAAQHRRAASARVLDPLVGADGGRRAWLISPA